MVCMLNHLIHKQIHIKIKNMKYSELIKDKDRAKELVEGSFLTSSNPAKSWERARKFISKSITSDGSILDVGCANGLLLKSLQEWSGFNLIPYGIDKNEECINTAKKLFEGNEGNFVLGSFFRLKDTYPSSYPDEFDYIYWGVWVDYKVEDTILKFLLSHLKVGGKLILGFYPDSSDGEADVIGNIKRIRDLNYSFTQMSNDIGGNEELIIFEKT